MVNPTHFTPEHKHSESIAYQAATYAGWIRRNHRFDVYLWPRTRNVSHANTARLAVLDELANIPRPAFVTDEEHLNAVTEVALRQGYRLHDCDHMGNVVHTLGEEVCSTE